MYLVSIHSGRMRQVSGSGVATIRILIDGEVVTSLDNPHPSLPSWQWVGLQLKKSGSNLTVMMTLNNFNTPSAAMAYFDDLCVTFSSTNLLDPGGGGMCLNDVSNCHCLYSGFCHNFVSKLASDS